MDFDATVADTTILLPIATAIASPIQARRGSKVIKVITPKSRNRGRSERNIPLSVRTVTQSSLQFRCTV